MVLDPLYTIALQNLSSFCIGLCRTSEIYRRLLGVGKGIFLWCSVFVTKGQRSNIMSYLITLIVYVLASSVFIHLIADVNPLNADWNASQASQAILSNSDLLTLLGVLALYTLVMMVIFARKQKSSIAKPSHSTLEYNSVNWQTKDDEPESEESQQSDIESATFEANHVIEQSQSTQSESEVDRLNAELVKTEQKLQSALSAKSQFLANMSHELRTPMNGILGMAELLIGSGLSDKQTRFADSARRSAESLLAIINDLLDYSKMESGKLFLENAAFNLREVVEDVCDLHADIAQRKGLELICHIDRSMTESVVGDSNRLRQMLSNLVGNAIKFTKEGEIVVRVKEVGSQLSRCEYQFDVVDTGIGITPEGQASIFESFTQEDNSYSREYGGAGLGLFISNKLISMMDGKISLRSRMNEGSHFTISLTLETTTKEKANATLQGTLRGSRVLIVDDNETNRTILYHQLKSWGVNPETVESGARALEALRAAKTASRAFHIAILDLHMPGMDGIELTRMIQADPLICDTQRIMLTSAALDILPEELRNLGISQYVSKPARQSQLYNVLANLIQNTEYPEEYRHDLEEKANFKNLEARVLLAEDNLINQDVALNMLENFGCEVKVVSNGRAAIEATKCEQFDVILMDCQMPIMDGLIATRRLRNSNDVNRNTPVIALTANVMEGDREKCLESGMNGYISKPVKQDELYKEVCHWFETSVRIRNEEDGLDAAQEVDLDAAQEVDLDAARETDLDAAQEADLDAAQEADLDAAQEADLDAAQEAVQAGDSLAEIKGVNEHALETIKKLQRPGKPNLVCKVINAYLDKSPGLLEEMKNGFSANDAKQVKEAAHSLKSSSAYVGAEIMSESCKQIELAAGNGNLEEVTMLVENISMEFEQIVAELTDYKNRAA